jgi:hypothetical protein
MQQADPDVQTRDVEGGLQATLTGGAALAGRVVGELLRIGVERIARLREAAVLHLRALLAIPSVSAGAPLGKVVCGEEGGPRAVRPTRAT